MSSISSDFVKSLLDLYVDCSMQYCNVACAVAPCLYIYMMQRPIVDQMVLQDQNRDSGPHFFFWSSL